MDNRNLYITILVVFMWIPSRREGLNRLNDFIESNAKYYAAQRNFDYGRNGHDYVSRLSPWIRHRIISEEEVVGAVLGRYSLDRVEKFVQEIFWRTYWKGWLEIHTKIWKEYTANVWDLSKKLGENRSLEKQFSKATTGNTGIDCFDDWTKELIQTGYLHNHARMWFASIWIFTLNLPWELGADFFYRHLLDGDPASNTLSWRWVAGLQTKGKTYLARPDNITKFTKGRYINITNLSQTAAPVGYECTPSPNPLPEFLPIKKGVPTGLLLTDEDLTFMDLFENHEPILSVGYFNDIEKCSPFPTASNVSDFLRGARQDALSRLKSIKKFEKIKITDCPSIATIKDWALRNNLRQIIMSYAPVGPINDALQGLPNLLHLNGINFCQRARKWDQISWPHASRGFFKLRKKIPAILSDLNLI